MRLQQLDEPELSDADALALFRAPEQEEPELSDEEALAAFRSPEAPDEGLWGLGWSSLASGAAQGLASMAGFAGKVVDLPQTLLGGVTGPVSPAASMPGAQLVAPVEQYLRQGAERAYPPEEREQAGLLGQVGETVGQMAVAGPAVALGPAAAALTFAAQNGIPAYYEVLQATGDEKKANEALWGNAAIGQLEFLGGGEKLFGGLLNRLMTGKLGAAIKNATLHFVVTGGREIGTETLQTGLSDLLHEELTGEDRDNLRNIIQTAKVAGIVSGPIAVLDTIVSREPLGKAATTAPPATQAAKPAAQPSAQTQPATPGAEAATPSAETTTQAPAATAAPVSQVGVPSQEEVAATTEEGSPGTKSQGVAAAEGTVPQEEYPEPFSPETRAEPATEEEVQRYVDEEIENIRSGKELPPPEEKKATGIKNATVARELKEMGLPPPEKGKQKSDIELHARAKAKFDADQHAGAKLVDRLEASPRVISDEESALLDFEANRLVNERDAAEAAYVQDPSAENKAAVEKAISDYKRAADVFDVVGTESGRSLRARRLMIARDYSLAAMERAIGVAKGGAPLTEKESARVKELHKKIAATEKAHKEYIESATKKRAELEAKQTALEVENIRLREQKLATKNTKANRQASIAKSKAKIDEILNKLAGGQRAAAGLDPQKIALTFQLATEHLKIGYQNFQIWADEVVAKVGEHIRPYLRPAWDAAKKEQDERLLKTYKTRKKGDIAQLKERTKGKLFKLEKRQTPVEQDPEAIRLKAEYEGAKKEYEREKRKHEIASMSRGKKLARAVHRLIRTPPHVLASFDLGGMLQQGGFFAIAHPLDTIFRDLPRSLRAGKSDTAARREMARIQNHPLYDMAVAAKLPMMDWEGGNIHQAEENLSESFAEQIPVLGRGVKASNRQFAIFMTSQRFWNFVRQVTAHGPDITADIAKKIAKDIGVVTGRGAVGTGSFSKAVDFLSSIFWSPRKNVGNVQTLVGQPLWLKGNRKQMAAEYVRFLVNAAGLLSLAYMAAKTFGDKKEKVSVGGNPLSTEFGKLRVGDTTYDFFGGKAQWITFMARHAANMAMTSEGRKYSMLRTAEDHKYTDKDITDITKDFMRGKLTPTLGAYIDWRTGKNMRGEEVTGKDVIRDLVIPLSPGDIWEAFNKHGIPRASAESIISILGGGVNIYKKKPKAKK